jgi:intein/homing endonuclease
MSKKCKIRLKSGKEVICSPDHKFFVREENDNEVWKQLKGILPTDFIFEDLV